MSLTLGLFHPGVSIFVDSRTGEVSTLLQPDQMVDDNCPELTRITRYVVTACVPNIRTMLGYVDRSAELNVKCPYCDATLLASVVGMSERLWGQVENLHPDLIDFDFPGSDEPFISVSDLKDSIAESSHLSA